MSLIKRCFVILIITVGFGIIIASCSGNDGPPPSVSLEFNETTAAVTLNSVTQVTLSLNSQIPSTSVVAYITSSNSTIAVVDHSQCTLSNQAGYKSSCVLTIRGLANGSAIITASASGANSTSLVATVSPTPVAGTLQFKQSAESVTVGSIQHVILNLMGSSGISNLTVEIANSNTGAVTVTQTKCILSSDTINSFCDIIVHGVAVGQSTLTATATGYTPATTTVNAITGTVPGTLEFNLNYEPIYVNANVINILTLVGSSGIESFAATISAQNGNASVALPNCILSTKKPVCYTILQGRSVGEDVVSANASGYQTANLTANVIADPIPGNLYFSQASESVVAGSKTSVQLILEGSVGVSDLSVSLNQNNQNVILSPTSCKLSSGTGQSICNITINGNITGSTIITAVASGYPQVTNTVTVLPKGTVVPGNLAFALPVALVFQGESIPVVLALIGSSSVESLAVRISSDNSSIATNSPISCNLSTTHNTCTVWINGIADSPPSALITAAATGYTSAQIVASVISTPILGTLVFTPPIIPIAASSGATAKARLQLLGSAGVNNLAVNIVAGNDLTVSKGFCCLSSSSDSCDITVNSTTSTPTISAVMGNPYPNPNNCGVANVDYSLYESTLLIVNVVQPIAVNRIITFKNNCTFPVTFGISGGGFAESGASCPSGSVFVESANECFWINPSPVNGQYTLESQQSTAVSIPAGSYQSSTDQNWSGGVTARLNCTESGICDIGTCRKTTAGYESLACESSIGFTAPSTNAEFTFLQNGQDTYDVQNITGISVPTSMSPDNNTYSINSSPYTCGEAGDIESQITSEYTLYASSWDFSPTAVGDTPVDAYNLISGSVVTNPNIGCSSSSQCSAGLSCGYTRDSISQGDSPLNYQFSCGYRLAYISGYGLWSANPYLSGTGTTNTAPFNFYAVVESVTSPYPNAGPNTNLYPTWRFYECANPNATPGEPNLPGSPYQTSTANDANSCGCINWNDDGIATPTESCLFSNAAWVHEVQPRIVWTKQGCPTCYTYPYDDPASTFQCHTNSSLTNPANNTNYTVTFCPAGTGINGS